MNPLSAHWRTPSPLDPVPRSSPFTPCPVIQGYVTTLDGKIHAVAHCGASHSDLHNWTLVVALDFGSDGRIQKVAVVVPDLERQAANVIVYSRVKARRKADGARSSPPKTARQQKDARARARAINIATGECLNRPPSTDGLPAYAVVTHAICPSRYWAYLCALSDYGRRDIASDAPIPPPKSLRRAFRSLIQHIDSVVQESPHRSTSCYGCATDRLILNSVVLYLAQIGVGQPTEFDGDFAMEKIANLWWATRREAMQNRRRGEWLLRTSL